MSEGYDDYESPSSNLDDVCERLDRIEETLKDARVVLPSKTGHLD